MKDYESIARNCLPEPIQYSPWHEATVKAVAIALRETEESVRKETENEYLEQIAESVRQVQASDNLHRKNRAEISALEERVKELETDVRYFEAMRDGIGERCSDYETKISDLTSQVEEEKNKLRLALDVGGVVKIHAEQQHKEIYQLQSRIRELEEALNKIQRILMVGWPSNERQEALADLTTIAKQSLSKSRPDEQREMYNCPDCGKPRPKIEIGYEMHWCDFSKSRQGEV